MRVDLAAMRDDAIRRIERTIVEIAPGKEWQDFHDEAAALCNEFLILAAASLLADMKPNLFFLNLCRCAQNWRRFMSLSRSKYQRTIPLKSNTPFLSAVIAGERSILQAMIEVMPAQWLPGQEYQDNFHITWSLVLLANNQVKLDDRVKAHITALEACEAEPSRILLVKALFGLDGLKPGDFWEQFENMLYQQEEIREEKTKSVSTSITRFAAHRYIWFEGLAWLQLARRKGWRFPTKSFHYCPDEALQEMPEPYAGDWIFMPDLKI